jgi:AcrR family transcriptional regulator
MASSPRRYAPRLPPAARREQLLDAALAVIGREGYAGLSIDSIAREAGVTRPVVYGTFDGLGPLLYALLDRQEQRALSQLLQAVPAELGGQDPDAFLVEAVGRLVEVVREDLPTWRPILLGPEGTPAAVRERIARDREVVRARIQALLEVGLERRGGPEVDAEIASHAILGLAEYFGRLLVEDPEGFEAERLVAMIEALLAALRPAGS